MFHLKFPRFQGFFSWEELGCLARALGYPVDLFKSNIRDEIVSEEHGITLKEAYKMVDHRLLERALHMTCNLHSGDWNMNVVRKSLYLVSHQALTFEEIYNIRLAYQAFEAFDMKGMLVDEHIILRSIKMCGRSIAPMKLMHRLKHMAAHFEDKTRIQLAEFLDLVLWCCEYKDYCPEDNLADLGRDKDLFRLVDFERLLSHHDHRLAKKLNQEYLEEEWDFGKENYGSKRMFKEPPVICGPERIEMLDERNISDDFIDFYEEARKQKKLYRHLKREVVHSQKSVYRAKAGFVRERPLTAPDLSMYKEKQSEDGTLTISAQTAYEIIQRRVNSAKSQRSDPITEEMADRPQYVPEPGKEIPRVISDQDIEETKKKYDNLIFDIATLEKRYKLSKEQELNYYIPGYSERDIPDSEDDFTHRSDNSPRPSTSPSKRSSSRVTIQNLAYPEPKDHDSHARTCDARKLHEIAARFRGWHRVKTKSGDHFILTSPAFQHSYKGICQSSLVKKADAEVKRVRGKFAHRYTKQRDTTKTKQDPSSRPFTAPAAMQRTKNNQRPISVSDFESPTDSNNTVDTGYGSSEEKVFDLTSSTPKGGKWSDTDSAYGSKSPLSTMNSIGSKSPINMSDIAQADENTECSLLQKKSEQKIQTVPSKESVKGTSLLLPSEQEFNERTLNKNMNPQKKYEIIKKKSTKQRETISVDNVPVPQMQHSKPKVVAVGGIGKISLLEDISESQYWEEIGDQEMNSESEEDECFVDDTEEIEIEMKTEEEEPRSKSEASLDTFALEERNKNLKLLSRRLNGEDDSSDKVSNNKAPNDSDICEQIRKEKEALKKKRINSQGSLFLNFGNMTPRKERRSSSRSSNESSKRSVKDLSSDYKNSEKDQPNTQTKTTNVLSRDNSVKKHDAKTQKDGNLVKQHKPTPKNNDQESSGTNDRIKNLTSKNPKSKFQRLVKRMDGDISEYMASRLLSGSA